MSTVNGHSATHDGNCLYIDHLVMTEYGLNMGHETFLIRQFLINLCCNDVSILYGSNSIFSDPDFSAANDEG